MKVKDLIAAVPKLMVTLASPEPAPVSFKLAVPFTTWLKPVPVNELFGEIVIVGAINVVPSIESAEIERIWSW